MDENMAILKFKSELNNNIFTMTNKTYGNIEDIIYFLSDVYNYICFVSWKNAKCILSYQLDNLICTYEFNTNSDGGIDYSSFYNFLLGCTYHPDVANKIIEGVLNE